MLTDDEKSHIREEEIYRQEVRRELAAREAPKPKSAIWTLLNSSFTLWFLSTVVVAGLTAAVTAYRSAGAEEAERERTSRKIVTEMGHRIFHALEGLRVMEVNVGRGESYLPATVYRQTIQTLNNDLSGPADMHRDLSIYPELRDRTLRSLVVELSTIADTSAQSDLRDVLVATETFTMLAGERDVDAADTVDRVTPRPEALAAIRYASAIASERLDKPRWRLSVLPRKRGGA